MMAAGELKHRIAIQGITRTADGQGGYTEAWSDVVTVWAKIEALSGRELWQAQQVQSAVTHRITIRYRSDITPAMRIKYGARYFNVDAVINPDEGKEQLQLLCKEQPA